MGSFLFLPGFEIGRTSSFDFYHLDFSNPINF